MSDRLGPTLAKLHCSAPGGRNVRHRRGGESRALTWQARWRTIVTASAMRRLAKVVELVDTQRSGRCAGSRVGVRVPPLAPRKGRIVGLVRRFAKPLQGQPCRGFESLPFRRISPSYKARLDSGLFSCLQTGPSRRDRPCGNETNALLCCARWPIRSPAR